ncbi:T9SS type B sorting domain-containing protein, partial [Parapedobacter soli]|uniref:T9SS type B sorting domain-containing protein n=1 Tax=Parapedobacter soli TaxID=416955 RepID=UPI0021C60FE9
VSFTNNSRTAAGSQAVIATISGDNYESLELTATLAVTPAGIAGVTLADGSFAYDGTAKSLAVSGTLPAGTSVDYTNNSRTAAGSQAVTATIGGDNYESLAITATLTVTPVARSIQFPSIPAKTFGDSDFPAGAVANTGEMIVYASSNEQVAVVQNGIVQIVGIGTATITATVAPNANYSNTPVVTQQVTVAKGQQTISLRDIGEVSREVGSIDLGASSSSGLPVTLTLDDEQVASLDGTSLRILRLGTVRITATQAGSANYDAAIPVTITVRVVDPAAKFPVRIHQAVSPNGDGINEFLMIEGIRDYPENRVTIFNKNGTIVYEVNGYDNGTRSFTGKGSGSTNLPAGTYFYIVEIKEGVNWTYHKGYFVLRY